MDIEETTLKKLVKILSENKEFMEYLSSEIEDKRKKENKLYEDIEILEPFKDALPDSTKYDIHMNNNRTIPRLHERNYKHLVIVPAKEGIFAVFPTFPLSRAFSIQHLLQFIDFLNDQVTFMKEKQLKMEESGVEFTEVIIPEVIKNITPVV